MSKVKPFLKPEHRQEFLDSGIPEDRIHALGHRSVSAAEIESILGRNDLSSGLAFQYRDFEGKPFTCKDGRPYVRVKTVTADRARYEGQHGKPLGKYLSPASEGCRPYIAQGVDPKFWRSHLTDLRETEGEKKVDAVASYGRLAIGFAGVDGWRDKSPRPGEAEQELAAANTRLTKAGDIADEQQRLKETQEASEAIAKWQKVIIYGELEESRPLPELDEIKYQHRRVLQIWDSDLIFNAALQASIEGRAQHLQFTKGAHPYCVVLPTELDGSKNGLDDFIARHGVEALDVLEALAPRSLVPAGSKRWKLNPEILEPGEAYKAAMIWALLKEEWAYRPGVGFYKWNGTVWEQSEEDEFRIYMLQVMDCQRWTKRTPGTIRAITDEVRGRLTVPERFWNPEHLLLFSNGTLNARQNSFTSQHKKTDYCTLALPFEWNPLAQCDRWKQFLEEATKNDAEVIELLRAFIRWTLEPKSNHKFSIEKSLELFGDKGTGKSTFLEVVQALVGEENVGSAGVDVFSSPEKLAQLVDKRLACATDINGFMPSVGVFNRVVSNEPVEIRKLYSDMKSVRLKVVVMRAYNAHVTVPSGSDGLDRRLVVVRFDERPARKDAKLLDKLRGELSGIFQWSWSMPMELAESTLHNSGNISSVRAASIERFRADNPEYEFLLDMFPDGAEAVGGTHLYNSFKQWCIDNGRTPINNNKFGERIRRLGCTRTITKTGRFWAIPPTKLLDIAAYMGISDPDRNAGDATLGNSDATSDALELSHSKEVTPVMPLFQKEDLTKIETKESSGTDLKNSPIETFTHQTGITGVTASNSKDLRAVSKASLATPEASPTLTMGDQVEVRSPHTGMWQNGYEVEAVVGDLVQLGRYNSDTGRFDSNIFYGPIVGNVRRCE